MKMTLTESQAIRECKQGWKHALKGGITKEDIIAKPEFQQWQNYKGKSPLCEYVQSKDNFVLRCTEYCPLFVQLGVGCYGFHIHPLAFAREVMKLKE